MEDVDVALVKLLQHTQKLIVRRARFEMLDMVGIAAPGDDQGRDARRRDPVPCGVTAIALCRAQQDRRLVEGVEEGLGLSGRQSEMGDFNDHGGVPSLCSAAFHRRWFAA